MLNTYRKFSDALKSEDRTYPPPKVSKVPKVTPESRKISYVSFLSGSTLGGLGALGGGYAQTQTFSGRPTESLTRCRDEPENNLGNIRQNREDGRDDGRAANGSASPTNGLDASPAGAVKGTPTEPPIPLTPLRKLLIEMRQTYPQWSVAQLAKHLRQPEARITRLLTGLGRLP